MPFHRTGGVLLHYRVRGPEGAPALVFVNSLGTDERIWDAVAEPLSQRFRVITYSKRGHGLSDVPAGDYSLDAHVADLAGLLDHLGTETIVLAGVSVGGLIAMGFALAYPERIRGLVVCDSAAQIGDLAFWTSRIDAVRAGGMAAVAGPVIDRWFPAHYREREPDATAGWRNMLLRMDAEGYVRTCATLRDADLDARLGAITTPTLVVAGEHDLATPPALVEATARRIAGARFELIAGGGHIPCIDQPQALLRLLHSFLHEVGHG